MLLWTGLLIAIAVAGFLVEKALRGTPYAGRRFGCGAGYQPKRDKLDAE